MEQRRRVNLRRGFFRLWVVSALMWMLAFGWLALDAWGRGDTSLRRAEYYRAEQLAAEGAGNTSAARDAAWSRGANEVAAASFKGDIQLLAFLAFAGPVAMLIVGTILFSVIRFVAAGFRAG